MPFFGNEKCNFIQSLSLEIMYFTNWWMVEYSLYTFTRKADMGAYLAQVSLVDCQTCVGGWDRLKHI